MLLCGKSSWTQCGGLDELAVGHNHKPGELFEVEISDFKFKYHHILIILCALCSVQKLYLKT